METFFGFTVYISKHLDPIKVEALKEDAKYIMNLYSYNLDEYFLYFHELIIKPKDEHFDFNGNLGERLENIEISFRVNQKQVKNGTIKLYNNYLKNQILKPDVKSYFLQNELLYNIKGTYLYEQGGFRNEIITFISKKVLKRHRKVKASILAYPTEEYKKHLYSQKDSYLTQLDVPIGDKNIVYLKKPQNQVLTNNKGTINNIDNSTIINNIDNSKTINNTINTTQIDSLEKILEAMKKKQKYCKKNDIEHFKKFINDIKNDKPVTKESLITRVGKKALNTAEKIGESVAVELIKSTLL